MKLLELIAQGEESEGELVESDGNIFQKSEWSAATAWVNEGLNKYISFLNKY